MVGETVAARRGRSFTSQALESSTWSVGLETQPGVKLGAPGDGAE